ncbi:uncharacterized protein F4822DRAFT_423975 [Hypoxylon trugodes]|uniref:uncharacterized protein n=1 Tax=Hypoxylon trugodes TaxID=326681 RepID=UPI00219CAD6E|nr:uncharacterized protein F4822DRAFT_423975 [Hypoxylon trugodes]KAI1393505.1 hypothetical protein F4822DRAFT_423975 [Hypoxylon trugodes]
MSQESTPVVKSGNAGLQLCENAMDEVYRFKEVLGLDVIIWTPPPLSTPWKRHLLTDGVAIINFLSMYAETHSKDYLSLATTLATLTHLILADSSAVKGLKLSGGVIWIFALGRLSLATDNADWLDLAVQVANDLFSDAEHRGIARIGGKSPRKSPHKSPEDDLQSIIDKGHDIGLMGTYYIGVVTKILLFSAELLNHKQSRLLNLVYRTTGSLQSKEHLLHLEDPLDAGFALWISHFNPDGVMEKQLVQDALSIFEGCLPEGKDGSLDLDTTKHTAISSFAMSIGLKCSKTSFWTSLVADKLVTFWEKKADVWAVGKDRSETAIVMYAAAVAPRVFNRE